MVMSFVHDAIWKVESSVMGPEVGDTPAVPKASA